jgi:hypothetical protein
MYLLCIFYSYVYLALHVSGAIAPILSNSNCSLQPQVHFYHGQVNLTVVKVRGCPSQYLLQWINTPKLLHTPVTVGYSWSYWGWVQ